MPHKLPFRIVYASSQDEEFPAVELNHHAPTTKGWVSSRFCTFPQRLILALQERSKIRKIQILCHHYLIASKVEFFVGETIEGDFKQYDNACYNLLGYVSLSDNKSTQFKARELKSAHVDTHGCYIQLVLHKNYQNVCNLYNQVGLIAVNLIGEDSRTIKAAEHGLVILRPDFVPPTEDLAFDIYQDPEVANIIRRLEKQKLVAVTEERFDQAKEIRDAITNLHRVGEKLGRLAIEKEQAVIEENYERAKLKKFQLNEMRSNFYRDLGVVQMLTDSAPAAEKPATPTTNKSVPEVLRSQPASPRTVAVPTTESIDTGIVIKYPDIQKQQHLVHLRDYSLEGNMEGAGENGSPSYLADPDERVLPVLKSRAHPGEITAGSNNNAVIETEEHGEYCDQQLVRQLSDAMLKADIAVREHSDHHHSPVHTPRRHAHPAADKPLLSKAMSSSVREPTEPTIGVMLDQPEPLTEANRRVAGVAIDVVGIDMVTRALSKSWVFREKALLELEQRVTQPKLMPPDSAVDNTDTLDPQAELRSTTFLLKRALSDQVLSLFRLATSLIKCAILDFGERHDLLRTELCYAMDALIPILFHRTGDNSIRIREIAKAQILTIAQWPQLRQCSSLWNEFVRPFSSITLDRLALSRVELATDLYAARGVEPVATSSTADHHGFTLDALATFTARALTHRLNEVRDAAENLMVALFRAENRTVVRRALPPDDINARRHPLYRRLFAKFDRIDSRRLPYDTEQKSPRANVSSTGRKQSDLDTLHTEVQRLRTMVNNNAAIKQTQSKQATKNISKAQSRTIQPSSRSRQRSPPKGCKPAPRKTASKGPTPVPRSDKEYATERLSPVVAKSPGRPNSSTLTKSELSFGDAELLLSLDRTCIFCGEHNNNFTGECLDLHYWKDCPMLYRCIDCKQVVEIASMTAHLLTECEASSPGRYQHCPSCLEAVSCDLLASHSCLPVSDNCLRCPLCHKDILIDADKSNLSTYLANGDEELWKDHFLGNGQLGVPTCQNNPRRPNPYPLSATKRSSPRKSPKGRSLEKVSGFSNPKSHAYHVSSSDAATASRSISTPVSHNRSCIPRPTHPTYVRPV